MERRKGIGTKRATCVGRAHTKQTNKWRRKNSHFRKQMIPLQNLRQERKKNIVTFLLLQFFPTSEILTAFF